MAHQPFTKLLSSARGPRHRGMFALLACCLLAALALVGCAPAASSPTRDKTLTVAAASDLQFAFTDLGRLFQEETGAKVTFLFGSSGTLATQIENGAPVDLFASADEGYLRELASRGAMISGTEQLYGIGRIVLVTYRKSGLPLSNLKDLLAPEVKHVAIANPDHAPYGLAARQALTSLGLWEQVSPKVVYGENVRQALQFVQTGNAEAGIVALSVASVPEVESTAIDDSLYQPLRQSMAIVKGTGQEQLARAFVAFVNGPRGRPVMKSYGFALPGEN